MEKTAVDGFYVVIPVAEIDQCKHGNHQHTALESAAWRKMTVEDNVKQEDKCKRDQIIAATACNNVLYFQLSVIHLFLPPPFLLFSSRRKELLPNRQLL